MATKIPDAVATNASDTPEAIILIVPLAPPICLKVSKIETTVPKSPIKGVVEETTDRNISPFVASLVAAYDAISKSDVDKRDDDLMK